MYIEHVAIYAEDIEKIKLFMKSILMWHQVIYIIIKKQVSSHTF